MKQLLKTLLLSSLITVPTAFGAEPETLGSSEGAQLSTTIEHGSEQTIQKDRIAELLTLTDDQFNATQLSYIFGQIQNALHESTADKDTVIQICKRASNHPLADSDYIYSITKTILHTGDAYYPEALSVFRKILEKNDLKDNEMIAIAKRISSKGFIFDDTAVALYEKAYTFIQEHPGYARKVFDSDSIPFLIRDIAKKYAEDSAEYNLYIRRALGILSRNLNFTGDDSKLKEVLLKVYPDSKAPFNIGKFIKEVDDILGE